MLGWLADGASFVLNVLQEGAKSLIGHFGKGFELGKRAFEGLKVLREREIAPVLLASHAYLVCRVAKRCDAGDHVLLIARVQAGAVLNEGKPTVHVQKEPSYTDVLPSLANGKLMDEPIISPDTRRASQAPPRRVQTRKWPVLHAGSVPLFDPRHGTSRSSSAVGQRREARFTWAEFSVLPRIDVFADMHCVTRWSLLDNLWEGVATRGTQPRRGRTAAKFVMIHCSTASRPTCRSTIFRRRLPLRAQAQRPRPYPGSRLPVASGAEALRGRARSGSAGVGSWKPTRPGVLGKLGPRRVHGDATRGWRSAFAPTVNTRNEGCRVSSTPISRTITSRPG